MITIGELDTPIRIQEPVFSANANYGGIQSTTWDTAGSVSTTWAFMIWKGGGEREEADQQVGEQKVDFYIRYETFKDSIQPNWRIRHALADATYTFYYIEKIAHIDGRHRITRLTAVQKDNN